MLVHRIFGVLLYRIVDGGAVKMARRLRQLGLRVFVGGSAMVRQGGTLRVDVAARNVCVSGVLRHRMHLALTSTGKGSGGCALPGDVLVETQASQRTSVGVTLPRVQTNRTA